MVSRSRKIREVSERERQTSLRLRQIRIELQRLFKFVHRFLVVHSEQRQLCPQGEVNGVGVAGMLAKGAQALGSCQFGAKGIRDPRDNVHLQFAELGAVAIEAVGPNMCAGVGRDKLGVDSYVFAGAPHASFERVTHAEFAPNLLHVDRLALVGEGGVASNDETILQMGEIRRQIVRDRIGEIVLVGVVAQVRERQDNDREMRRAGRGARHSRSQT